MLWQKWRRFLCFIGKHDERYTSDPGHRDNPSFYRAICIYCDHVRKGFHS